LAKHQVLTVLKPADNYKVKRRESLDTEHKLSIMKEFEPGGKGFGKSYFDDDWFRFYPDGTWENHELCAGCNPDGRCDFHPEDDWYDFEEEQEYIEYPTVESIPHDVQQQLLEDFEKGKESGMTNSRAIDFAVDNMIEELEENDAQVTRESYLNMEKMLARETLSASGKEQYTRQVSASYRWKYVATQSEFSKVKGLILKSFNTEYGRMYAWFAKE
jgi:hypothetical protein